MTVPPPPSSGFSAQDNVGALIAIKALRVDPKYPDKFNRNEGRPVTAIFLDVWVLADSKEVGEFYSDTANSSRLGRQFQNDLGVMFYGRLVAEKQGAGTSVILGEPYPTDGPLIEIHKAQLAAEQAPTGNPNYRPPTYQNEPAWQAPAPQPTYAPQVAPTQPAYQPTAPYAPPQPAQPTYPPAPQPYAPPAPLVPPVVPPTYVPQVYPPGAPPAPPAPPAQPLPTDPPF